MPQFRGFEASEGSSFIRTSVRVLSFALLTACNASGGQARGEDARAAGRSPETVPSSQEHLPPRGEAWVIFTSDTVRAEVARTPEEREQGLMFRESLEKGRGMLFIFPDAQIRSFWMRNTLLPLDIAYIDENLRIVDIQAMTPGSEDLHPSAEPAMFALEVPQGWFREKGIGVGSTARLVLGPG
jgi:uncharacterized membrane protein (UPF0127 family)